MGIRLIKFIKKKNYTILKEKYDDVYLGSSFVKKDTANKLMKKYRGDGVLYEVDFNVHSIKEIIQEGIKKNTITEMIDTLLVLGIKEDLEIVNVYLNNPLVLKKLNLKKIEVNEDLSIDSKILKNLFLIGDSDRNILFKCPSVGAARQLLISHLEKTNYETLKDINSNFLEDVIYAFYSNFTFCRENNLKSLIYDDMLCGFVKNITNILIDGIESDNEENKKLAVRIFDIISDLEEDKTYSLEENQIDFKKIYERINKLDVKKKEDFLNLLKKEKKGTGFKFYTFLNNMYNKKFFKESDLFIAKETIIKISKTNVEEHFFSNLEEPNFNFGNDIFNVSLNYDDFIEIRYSIPLDNLTQTEIIYNVFEMIIGEKKIPKDLPTYFRELNLKTKLSEKEDIKNRKKM